MSLSSGFFNSLNGDRRYNAEQMSAIFDGIINDGVFMNIGETFAVKGATGNNITVGTGRAWFSSTWIYNDAILPLTATESEVVLNRYDAVVFDVDRTDSVRNATIKIISGTPATSPEKPDMISTDDHKQYPLCYIYRKADSDEIYQADIENVIGTSECPFVTGILETADIDQLVAQWEGQWEQWFATETENDSADISEWMIDKKGEFDEWFNALSVILDGDVAASLADAIVKLQERFTMLAEEHSVYADPDNPDEITKFVTQEEAGAYLQVVSFNPETGELVTTSGSALDANEVRY